MKSAILTLFLIAFGAAFGPPSTSWVPTLDARPEAIATGGALLVLAAVLRSATHRRAK